MSNLQGLMDSTIYTVCVCVCVCVCVTVKVTTRVTELTCAEACVYFIYTTELLQSFLLKAFGTHDVCVCYYVIRMALFVGCLFL